MTDPITNADQAIEALLPCDVRLPPATTIRAGCKVSTLLLALSVEGRPKHFKDRVASPSDDETYEIGKRDGYEKAVQDIDQRTGGDGEYRYCTDHDPERHCPDAPAMIQRIIERFASLAPPDPAAGVTARELLAYSTRAGDTIEDAALRAIEASLRPQPDLRACVDECRRLAARRCEVRLPLALDLAEAQSIVSMCDRALGDGAEG